MELALPVSWHSRQQESRRSSPERERERGRATETGRQRRGGRALATGNLMGGPGKKHGLSTRTCGLEAWDSCSLAE